MIKLIDAVRSVLEATVSSGSTRVENIHNLVVDYARGYIDGDKETVDRDSVYQLVRDITAEVGGFADDMVDVGEDVRATLKQDDPDVR
ncbi:MAG: hypothetical protein P1U64_01540 [Alcanivoracaceae bacterium]|nr:hypothetical protein [Alcanivoracaceae bacterium]